MKVANFLFVSPSGNVESRQMENTANENVIRTVICNCNRLKLHTSTNTVAYNEYIYIKYKPIMHYIFCIKAV